MGFPCRLSLNSLFQFKEPVRRIIICKHGLRPTIDYDTYGLSPRLQIMDSVHVSPTGQRSQISIGPNIHKKFLNSDWLRAVQFFQNTVPKMKYSVKKKYTNTRAVQKYTNTSPPPPPPRKLYLRFSECHY